MIQGLVILDTFGDAAAPTFSFSRSVPCEAVFLGRVGRCSTEQWLDCAVSLTWTATTKS